MSGRKSVRQFFSNKKITQSQLLDILYTAYGKTSKNYRNTPCIGGNFPLSIYILNNTASYLYHTETNSVVLHSENITKNNVASGWAAEGSSILVIVWDRVKEKNQYFASAEAGCVVQKVYLKVRSMNLGTVCIGSINSRNLRIALSLTENMTPLLMMPIGYISESYPPSSPDYTRMAGNLPLVLYSNISLDDSLYAHYGQRNSYYEKLSSQELSQILWAAYGYSNSSHRTTPSAHGKYPLLIYYINQTGTYRYHPGNHSISTHIIGDKREELLKSVNDQSKNMETPGIFVLSYNVVHEGGTGDGQAMFSDVDHEFIEVDVGCVIQNIFLEANAWGFEPSILHEGLEEWDGAGADNIRNALNLRITSIPLYIVQLNPIYSSTNGTETAEPEPEIEPEPEEDDNISGYLVWSIGIVLLFISLILYMKQRR